MITAPPISNDSSLLFHSWQTNLLQSINGGEINVQQTVSLLKMFRDKLIGNEAIKIWMVENLDICSILAHILANTKHNASYGQILELALVNLGTIGQCTPFHNLYYMLAQNPIVSGKLSTPEITQNIFESLSCHKDSQRVIVSSWRTLKILYKRGHAPKDIPFLNSNWSLCINCLCSENITLSEYAAIILSSACDSSEKAELMISSKGALDKIFSHIHAQTVVLEPMLYLLSSIFKESIDSELGKSNLASIYAIDLSRLVDALRNIMHHERTLPNGKLLSAKCLTYMKTLGLLRKSELEKIAHDVLGTLLSLFSEKDEIAVKAPLVLATLIGDDESLQLKIVAETDVIKKLHDVLERPNSKFVDQSRESALSCLTAIGTIREECRKAIIEAKIVPLVVNCLQTGRGETKLNACQCARALSRSVKALRTVLIDSGIADPLISILNESGNKLRNAACAVICNLVLDFSPMRKIMIEKNVITLLVRMINDQDHSTRINALWAFKNLVYQAEPEIKQCVTRVLTYKKIFDLIEDPHQEIQAQALNILRNLACGKESDIQHVVDGLGAANLKNILDTKVTSKFHDIVSQTIYVGVNVATGSKSQKELVMESRIFLDRLHQLLKPNGHRELLIGALWVVINLAWTEDQGYNERVSVLKKLGFDTAIAQLVNVHDADVRERVETALKYISG